MATYGKFVFLSLALVGALILSGCAPVAVKNMEGGEAARLYALNCAACHGAAGDGGIGVPLALQDFQSSVTDDYLFRTIRLGRPGRVMPNFSNLRDEEVQSIVRFIRGWAINPPNIVDKPVQGGPLHGKALFGAYCAECHGAGGEGGAGTGVTFSRPRDQPIMAPGLNNIGYLAAASDQVIKATLMHGRDGTPMRSFRRFRVSEQDIDDIVSYVRSFELQAARRQALPPRDARPALVFQSPHDFAKTVHKLKQAMVARNFLVIREGTLESGLVNRSRENQRQWVIYFGNLEFIDKPLRTDPRFGLFLPGRVTVVEQDGVVRVMAANPLVINALFNNDGLAAVIEELYQTYMNVLREAAT